MHCSAEVAPSADVLLFIWHAEQLPTAPFFEYVPCPHATQAPPLM